MSEHHDHSHAVVTEGNSKKLMFALGLTTTFLIVEVVAAFITQSLALLSDAAHMFTDVAALAIALAAIKIGKKAADDKRTFGYQRFEILAALFNAVMLFVVAIYIVYEAYQRYMNGDRSGMVLSALAGAGGLMSMVPGLQIPGLALGLGATAAQYGLDKYNEPAAPTANPMALPPPSVTPGSAR